MADRRPPTHRRTTSEPESAEEVLTLVSRGDEHAFERLYDTFAKSVYGLAHRLLRDPEHAAEVTQECFIEIWTNSSSFDAAKGNAQSWILTLTHRRAIDRIRSVHSQRERDQRHASAQHAGSSFDVVAAQIEHAIEVEQLHTCFKTLTALQRDALTLAYYAGHTTQEIASLAHTTPATVKTRIRDGLIKLRKCMESTTQ